MVKMKRVAPGEKITDIEKYLFTGPVKDVMAATYKTYEKDGEVKQGKLLVGNYGRDEHYIACFSKEGVLLRHETFSNKKSVSGTLFNELGQSIETYNYYDGRFSTRLLHRYNEQGQYAEGLSLDEQGKVKHRYVHTYNDLGQPIEYTSYAGDGDTWTDKTVYEYDDKIHMVNGKPQRNLLSNVRYKAGYIVDYTHTIKYNEKGLKIEDVSKWEDEKMKSANITIVYSYNSHDDIIEMIRYREDGSMDTRHTWTPEYDADGKKIEDERPEIFDPYPLEPGEMENFRMDHHGNWIERTVNKNNKTLRITVRQITYYGEPSEKNKPFVHPLMEAEEEAVKDTSSPIEKLDPKDAKWLAEGASSADKFSLHRYYALQFCEVPSVVEYTQDHIEVIALLNLLKKNFRLQMIFSTLQYHDGERLTSYVLTFEYNPGYILSVTNISTYISEEYEISGIENFLDDDDYYLNFGEVELLRPPKDSEQSDESFEDDLTLLINECAAERKPEKPYIYVVETTNNSFVMKSHPVKDNFEIRDLDINYGYGFKQFHDDLMYRFNTSTKGLVLFHGEPGTGKTYYIRHLLRKMASHQKKVVYMPPNMVDYLTDPSFMTFLANQVRNWSASGHFCVLLIEDAEPLLAKRREGVRIQGVTNLLNLSDGLLNDLLNLQIICTFNVDLKKLDSALLRPGRLIARKEFKKLEELDANLLAQRLGIKHHFAEPASLGEIYGMLKNQNTLIHDVASDRDSSGNLDDL